MADWLVPCQVEMLGWFNVYKNLWTPACKRWRLIDDIKPWRWIKGQMHSPGKASNTAALAAPLLKGICQDRWSQGCLRREKWLHIYQTNHRQWITSEPWSIFFQSSDPRLSFRVITFMESRFWLIWVKSLKTALRHRLRRCWCRYWLTNVSDHLKSAVLNTLYYVLHPAWKHCVLRHKTGG